MNAPQRGWDRLHRHPLASNAAQARTRLDRELDQACALTERFCQRQRLGEELQRLERLQHLAHLWPSQWRLCTADCGEPLALWLFGVALGVAGLGLAEAALAMLDVLPGVAAGAQGRRELLQSLLLQTEALAGDLADAPALGRRAGGGR